MAILSTDFADCFGFNPASFVNRKTADLGLSPASDYYCEQVTPSAGRALFNLRPNSDYVQPAASSPLDAAQVREVRDATSVVDSGVAPPTAGITAAVGAAGAMTGAYYYNTVFELDDGTLTEPWPGTATVVNPAAQRVNLSNIPVSPSSRVVARRLYRTVAGPVDVKDYRYLTRIADNTTTTYADNATDGTLGAAINWPGTANGVAFGPDGTTVIRGLGSTTASQALAMGYGSNAGYASISYGHNTLASVTTGRRNNAVGVYALTNLTTGYQNNAFGTHAGQSVTTGFSGVFVGYNAGFSIATAEETTAIGTNAAGHQSVSLGRRVTCVGANTLLSIAGAYTGNTALGYAAGKYQDANYQVSIDCGIDRSNTAGTKNVSLIFGQGTAASPQTQYLYLNGGVRLGWDSPTVSQLPAASATLKGCRAYVNDASVTYVAANIGSTVVGGGANCVPVFCNGAAWVIG